MVRATADGLIDFTTADPRDFRWWLRLEFMLEQLAQHDLRQVLQLSLQLQLGLLAAAPTAQARSHHRQDAVKDYQDYLRLLLGQEGETTQQQREKLSTMWTTAWEQRFGSLQNPATQQNIDALANWLRKQRQGAG